ncbi:MAG: hypothetical protein Q8L78_05225 [Coxiellaceae bacterium]|nr:hypothetical protein [Coxiellaceae bacterium]
MKKPLKKISTENWTSSNLQGEIILQETLEFARSCFKEKLIACYALGSLAHGGFCPLVSDVDIAIIIDDQNVQDVISVIQNKVKETGLSLSERLSIFWGSVNSLQNNNGGRFPALDKLDLIENGRLLFGKDIRSFLPKPTQLDLIITGAQFALDYLATPEKINDIKNPELLFSRGVRHLTKMVLFPVRFLYTAKTGKMGHNEDAVNYYLKYNDTQSSELVKAAFQWRFEAPHDKKYVVTLLKKYLLEIYNQFIDLYVLKMSNLGEVKLVSDLKKWKQCLNANFN